MHRRVLRWAMVYELIRSGTGLPEKHGRAISMTGLATTGLIAPWPLPHVG
ncbi:MAG: hypothetical protein ACXVDA_21855 [Ktedonobacterales bacterium]